MASITALEGQDQYNQLKSAFDEKKMRFTKNVVWCTEKIPELSRLGAKANAATISQEILDLCTEQERLALPQDMDLPAKIRELETTLSRFQTINQSLEQTLVKLRSYLDLAKKPNELKKEESPADATASKVERKIRNLHLDGPHRHRHRDKGAKPTFPQQIDPMPQLLNIKKESEREFADGESAAASSDLRSAIRKERKAEQEKLRQYHKEKAEKRRVQYEKLFGNSPAPGMSQTPSSTSVPTELDVAASAQGPSLDDLLYNNDDE